MSGKRMMKTSNKSAALIVSLALILTAVLGATAAYLMTQSDGITNTFTPGQVSCKVVEDLTSSDTKIITVENTSDTAAYIRVTLVATWQTDDGTVYAKAPVEGPNKDYTVSLGARSNWVQNGDYYYYKDSVAANGGKTTDTITVEATANTSNRAPEGYSLHVEVLAEAVQVVQGNPTEGAIYAWNVDPTTGQTQAPTVLPTDPDDGKIF